MLRMCDDFKIFKCNKENWLSFLKNNELLLTEKVKKI